MRQCELLDIPFVESPDAGLKDADLVVDAIFGEFQYDATRHDFDLPATLHIDFANIFLWSESRLQLQR